MRHNVPLTETVYESVNSFLNRRMFLFFIRYDIQFKNNSTANEAVYDLRCKVLLVR